VGKIIKKPKRRPAYVRRIALQLEKCRKELGKSRTEFVTEAHLSHTNTTKMFDTKGYNSPLSTKSLLAIAKKHGVSPNYVLLDIGGIFLPGREPRKKTQAESSAIVIPRVDSF
jgi:hypothetical protein